MNIRTTIAKSSGSYVGGEVRVQFNNEVTARAVRKCRIIHGKGLSSPGREPVLKRHILGWLKKMDTVIAVSSATPRDGGTGAVYVLLKKK